jgi:hypothetical protein
MNIPTDKKNRSVENMLEILMEPVTETNQFRVLNEWKKRMEKCYDLAFKDGYRQRDAEAITSNVKN